MKDQLTTKLDSVELDPNLVSSVEASLRIITKINGKLPIDSDPEEVEIDVNGYWIKKKAWESGLSLKMWIETFLINET